MLLFNGFNSFKSFASLRAMEVINEMGYLCGGQWPRKVVALEVVAARLPQQQNLLIAFHAFGNDLNLQVARQTGNSRSNGQITAAGGNVVHKTLVEPDRQNGGVLTGERRHSRPP